MRINQDTVLQGIRATLVPYTPAHVPRYVARVPRSGFTSLF